MVKTLKTAALLVLCAVMLTVGLSAYAAEIPEIAVPDDPFFKTELSMPQSVAEGDSFTAGFYVKKLYKTISDSTITSVYGELHYDSTLFEIVPSSYNGNGYTVEITQNDFTVTFSSPVNGDGLLGLTFSVAFNALVIDGPAAWSDRVYIYTDNVAAYGETAFHGIGGIGYTEFVCTADDASSDATESESSHESSHEVSYAEASEEPYDQPSEEPSRDESSTYENPYSEPYYEPSYSPPYFEEPSDTEQSEPAEEYDVEQRYLEFLTEYSVTAAPEGFAVGFKPRTSVDELCDSYDEITLLQYTSAANGYVCTDDLLLFFDRTGSVYKRLTCVVLGDVDCNGIVNPNDYVRLRLYILKLRSFSPAQQAAADFNSDGRVTVPDYIALRRFLLGIS